MGKNDQANTSTGIGGQFEMIPVKQLIAENNVYSTA